MTTALVVITDGRADYLAQTIESAYKNLTADFGYQILVDDSGNPDYSSWLRKTYPEFKVIHHHERRGLGGAVESAWAEASKTNARYVFHLEDDFTFNGHIDLGEFADVLNNERDLAQLALKRQPWSPEEVAAGGFIELTPDDYDQHAGWVEHRRLFTFNPCLIPRWVFDQEWSAPLERDVTARLFCDPAVRAGIWGQKADSPRVHHIGVDRSDGYRW